MSLTDPHTERITVFIVDDHDVVRKGLRFYLSAHPEIGVVGEAGDAESAVQGVAEQVPDVVLMDLLLPLQRGLSPRMRGACRPLAASARSARALRWWCLPVSPRTS